MKLLLFALWLIFAPNGMAQPQADLVKAVLSKRIELVRKLQYQGMKELYAPDAQLADGGHLLPSIESYWSGKIPNYQKFEILNYAVPSLKIEGNYAFGVEDYDYDLLTADAKVIKGHGVVTSVLRNDRGTWRIIQLHISNRRKP